jgi:uncharacterized protein (TIGR02246 family)
MTARTKQQHHADTDEAVIRAIPQSMIEAWNSGDATAFAARFTEDASFVAFEGTELQGRGAIVQFHQQLFDTQLKGTRLEGGARFVRFLSPDVAVMHARCSVIPAWRDRAIASRESMQLFVCARHGREWRVAALMNARRLTFEQQLFADACESLAESDRLAIESRVSELAARQPGTSP